MLIMWVKLDDDFLSHKKQRAAGLLGRAMWLAGLAFSNKAVTDGFIPDYMLEDVAHLAGVPASEIEATLDKLLAIPATCKNPMWYRVAGGYQIHDYDEFQLTEDRQAEISARRREAGQKGGLARAEALAKQNCSKIVANCQANDIADAEQNSSGLVSKTLAVPVPVPVPVPEPDPVPESESTTHTLSVSASVKPARSSKPKHAPAEFAAFYAAYPRADDPGDAAKAWDSVKPDEGEIEAISRALARFGGKRLSRDMAVHCKAPGAWLRARRWESTDPFPGLTIASNGKSAAAAISDPSHVIGGLRSSAQEIEDYRNRRDGRLPA